VAIINLYDRCRAALVKRCLRRRAQGLRPFIHQTRRRRTLRLPFFIAAFALTLAVGVFALAGRGGQVVAQEPEPTPDPCITEEPAEEPTVEPTAAAPIVEPTAAAPTVEPTVELTLTAGESTTDESANALQAASDNDSTVTEDFDAVLQEECEETETVTGETPIVDPRNFPTVGGRVDPLPPAAQVETSSPARAEADAARAAAAAAAAAQQPAALPATGMGPGETSSSFSWGAALSVVLLGVAGVTALAARRQES
jgi:hypothetical protein